MRRCVACWGPLPAGSLITCSPKCDKTAREAEAKRLRDAQAAYLARSTDAPTANNRATPASARDDPLDPRRVRQ